MTMKKLVRLILFVMLVVISGSCAKATPQPVDEIINPGDKIGDFLITMGQEGDVTYNFDLDSAIVQQGNEEVYAVHIPVGTKMNVSIGFYDSTYSGKLDEDWSGHTYEMFIGGRPVNLQAFGPIDVPHQMVGTIRYWNVVIVATKPGEITVDAKGAQANGTPFDETKIYTFSVP
jgi:hypothetical protein